MAKVRQKATPLSEAAKEARRAYKREWARNNPEKVRAAQQRYWQKRADKMQEAATQTTTQTQEV